MLLNVALHGMEEAAGVRYMTTGVNAGKTWPGSPVLVRYADDGLVFCRDAGQAQQVKQQLQRWLEPRGLAFNQAKTKIVLVNMNAGGGCDGGPDGCGSLRGDGGAWPSGDALRGESSNHPPVPWLKTVVLNGAGKVGT